MSTITYSDALLPLAGLETAARPKTGPSLLSRLYAAMIASRTAQAEREIARLRHVYGLDLEGKALPVSRSDLPF